jgi:hypothetical protein
LPPFANTAAVAPRVAAGPGVPASVPSSGHPSNRPATEIIVIPRSLELIAAEDALFSLALVALVYENHPPVSPTEVWDQ